MKHYTALGTLLLVPSLVFATAFGGVSATAFAGEKRFATDRPTPEKVALIVAVSDYPDGSAWEDLPGARNDLGLVKDLLTERFGFEEEDILTLRDEEATHENIVRAYYEWLIERSGPDTQAVFWYSGHGSRVPDLSGEKGVERDFMDSTLIAYDSRIDGREGSFDVSDDELASLLLALTAKTSWATIVTDSCHSGGVMRGQRDPRIRSIPAGKVEFDFDLVEPFWPKDVEFLDDDGIRADPERYVHISACGSDQSAFEWYAVKGDDETANGALTLFLDMRLRRTEPGQTYRQVVDTVGRWVSTRLPAQSVQREGAIDRAFLGSRFEPRPRGFEAFASGRNRIRLKAGRLHGLRRGSRLEVLDVEGNALGGAEVVSVQDVSCHALWKGPPPAGATDIAMLAIETRRPSDRRRLAVRLSHPLLAARLGERGDVRWVQSDASDAYTLEVLPVDAKADDEAKVILRAPDGTHIWPGESGKVPRSGWIDWVAEAIGEPLDKERRYQEVIALAEIEGGLRLDAGFVSLESDDLIGKGDGRNLHKWSVEVANAEVRAYRDPRGEEHTSSDFVAEIDRDVEGMPLARLDVTNSTGHEVFVSVLSVTEAREITVLFPDEGEEEIVLGSGETIPVYTILGINDQLDLGRPMRDRYIVVATREPANLHALNQESTLRNEQLPIGVPAMIESAFTRRTMRGGLMRVDEEIGATFGITTVDLLVSESTADASLPVIDGLLDDEVRVAFEDAESIDLVALHPYPHLPEGKADSPAQELHGYKVLGRAAVGGPEAREVVSLVWRGIRDGGTHSRCFEPRHALVLNRPGEAPMTLVICYECNQILVYVGAESRGDSITSGWVKPTIDRRFESTGLRIYGNRY